MYRRRGVALLLVLMAVAVAATLATSFLSAQNTSIGIARNIQDFGRARYVAESGLELAIAHVRANASWRTDRPNGTWVSNEAFASGTFTIVGEDGVDTDGDGSVDGDGDLTDDADELLTLTVTGRFNGPSYVVRAVLTPDSGTGSPYDFTTRTPDGDAFAYADATLTQVPGDDVTPSGPTTVLSAAEYDKIKTDDGIFSESMGGVNGDYPRQRFEFSIDEDADEVTQIDVTWNGKGINDNNGKPDGVGVYVWRYTGTGGNAYELLVTSPDTEAEVTVIGSVTSDLSDYIGPAGQVSIVVVASDKVAGIPHDNVVFTDFISLTITASGSAGGLGVRWLD